MALKSKVGNTSSGKGDVSLRCSVPQGIASWMGVKAGDYLYWHMTNMNEHKIAIVTLKDIKIVQADTREVDE